MFQKPSKWPKTQNSPTSGTKWTIPEINLCEKLIFLKDYVFCLWSHKFANCRKSSKMQFPEYPPKVVQLQNYIKSSEMVVHGRYMTHFDRRDLLKSEKIGLGGFCNLSDLQRSIHQFLRFFMEISDITRNLKKSSASTIEFKKFFQKLFSCKNIWMRENWIH